MHSTDFYNPGQVRLGCIAAFGETGLGGFADAARRAACYLVATLDSDGHWRRGNSQFARADATLYNTRTAWALAEAGARLGDGGVPPPPPPPRPAPPRPPAPHRDRALPRP